MIGVPDDLEFSSGMVHVLPLPSGVPRSWRPGVGGVPSAGRTGSAALRAVRCSSSQSRSRRGRTVRSGCCQPDSAASRRHHRGGRALFLGGTGSGTDPDDFVVKCAVGGPRSVFAGDDDSILGLHGGHRKLGGRRTRGLALRCRSSRRPMYGRNVPDWLLAQQQQTADRAGSVKTAPATRGVKRSQGATLRHHQAQEGVSAAQSDAVEVADDDAVGLPQRRLVYGTFRRAVGGDERLHLAEEGRAIEGNRWCSI